MSLFASRPRFRQSYGRVQLTKNISEMLEQGEYYQAADSIIIAQYQFNEVIRLISNCPAALAAYLYKYASSIGISPSSLQMVCHLYLEVALARIQTLSPDEKKNEIARVRKFITDFKSSINYHLLKRLVDRNGITTLMDFVAQTFQDYEAAISYLFEIRDYHQVCQNLSKLPPEKQRPIILRLEKNYKLQLLEYITDENCPSIPAIYDALVEYTIQAPTLKDLAIQSLPVAFEMLYQLSKGSVETMHTTLYIIFLVALNDSEKIMTFINGPIFNTIRHDFLVSYLIERKLFKYAAEVYARCERKHLLAVSYAMEDSLDTCLSLLKNPLKKAADLRECWLYALRLYQMNHPTAADDSDWEKLVDGATRNHTLSLDDIFAFVPKDMPLDNLSKTISKAVEDTSNSIKSSEKTRSVIEVRAEALRRGMNEGTNTVYDIDPTKSACAICGQPACDSRFIAFRCGHYAHVQCYNNEMEKYLSSEEYERVRGGSESDITEALAKSCPACGPAALNILNVPFVDESKESDKIRLWEVPEQM